MQFLKRARIAHGAAIGEMPFCTVCIHNNYTVYYALISVADTRGKLYSDSDEGGGVMGG